MAAVCSVCVTKFLARGKAVQRHRAMQLENDLEKKDELENIDVSFIRQRKAQRIATIRPALYLTLVILVQPLPLNRDSYLGLLSCSIFHNP